MPLGAGKIFHPKDHKLNQLSSTLLEVFGKGKRGRRRKKWDQHATASYNRADIVDEKACDDIIKYLAPTLAKHKGCSIIDVHPGACLFSQKLHEYLKPKWHLLMEPEERYVEPFIQPLLDKPGSTYRHTYLAGAHPSVYWESYKKLHEDPTLFPPRPALDTGDPKLRELDPSVLVVGNLERAYATRRLETALLLFHQMPYAALSNELFQRSGLVRMLWWIPERIKHPILARNPMVRSAFSHSIEMGTNIREIAGVNPVQALRDSSGMNRKRPNFYDQIVTERVAQRMQESGFSAPEGRELLGIDYAEGEDTSESSHRSPFEFTAKTKDEFEAKISRLQDRIEQVRHADHPTVIHLIETMEYPQSTALIGTYRTTTNLHRTRGPLFLDLGLRVLNLEASYKDLEDKGEDKPLLDKLREDILTLDAEVLALARDFAVKLEGAILDMTEDMVAFYMSPQHTPLDRRPFEPLKLHSTDFFPPTTQLALIDMTPKSRDLSVPDLADNKEAARICAEMLRQLYTTKSRNVVDALNTFAVNAGQDLVPMVPAIYDVRKGGRLNPKNLRVRMLTEEMVEGLVKAFFEWPFRPQTWEVTAMGDSGGAARGDEGSGGEGEGEGDGQGSSAAAEH